MIAVAHLPHTLPPNLFKTGTLPAMPRLKPPTKEESQLLPAFAALPDDAIYVPHTAAELEAARTALLQQTALGFDTESKPLFHTHQVDTGPPRGATGHARCGVDFAAVPCPSPGLGARNYQQPPHCQGRLSSGQRQKHLAQTIGRSAGQRSRLGPRIQTPRLRCIDRGARGGGFGLRPKTFTNPKSNPPATGRCRS